MMYRRTAGQMAAKYDEIEEMGVENIEIETLMNPHSARVEDGKLVGVTFQRNTIEESATENGKPRVHVIEGTEEEYPCDLLIVAIGQTRTLDILPEGVHQLEDDGHSNLAREGLHVRRF